MNRSTTASYAEITAATAWDDDQITRWAALRGDGGKVRAVYGCRQKQVVGHGRAPGDVPAVSDATIERHSELARRLGIDFLYLLNGRCEHLDLNEATTRAAIVRDLEWIVERVRASAIVVADRRVARLARSIWPSSALGIRISTVAGVRTTKQLESWLEFEPDGVVLHHDAAREFDVLAEFVEFANRRAPAMQPELLLNESCLHGCVSRAAHYARLAAAQMGYVEGFQQNCNLPKFKDPSLVLAANWIRPNDLPLYEAIGIRRFKIAGREMSAAWLDRVVLAYVTGDYRGNLVDLLTMTPPGLSASAADVFYVRTPALDGFLEQLRTWTGSPADYYSDLANRLWQTGDLRVRDPGAVYKGGKAGVLCCTAGKFQQTLRELEVVSDPAYRPRRADRA